MIYANILGPDIMGAFTGPLVLWFHFICYHSASWLGPVSGKNV